MLPNYSWVEVHGATTHFPIALLILAGLFDVGTLLFRKPAWRDTSLLLLIVAVVSLPISLLSGYLTGRDYARPPVGFDWHWMAAVATTILAVVVLIWRLWTHDRLPRAARAGALALTLASAAAVSFTGFLGGQMVFGDRETSTTVAQTIQTVPQSTSTGPNVAEQKKLGVAAGRMETAAKRLDSATQKLAASSAQLPATSATATNVTSTSATPATSTDNKIAEMNRTAEKLKRAAARFEQSAQRLERLAASLPASSTTVNAGTRPASSASTNSATRVAQSTSTPKTTPNAAKPSTSAPAQTPASAFDPQLLAAGEKLLRSDDLGCLSCHLFNGEGRNKGPDLTFAGRLHSDLEWQIAHLKDPASKVPGSKMPAYDDMSEPDLRALSTFLISRK